jgi:protein gp37
MGTDSLIEWTDHTFNPWRGCTKVSDGCKFCYAEKTSKRNPSVLGIWGPNGTRAIAAESYWNLPEQWNRAAQKLGQRHKVFCASLADVFEGDDTMPAESIGAVHAARIRLFDLIYRTKNLDWLLLTKRPEKIMDIVGGDSGAGLEFFRMQRNIWLGTSVEDQRVISRIDHLLAIPAIVKWLSIEPLIGPVSLPEEFLQPDFADDDDRATKRWVIVGCESGAGRRPMDLNWLFDLRDQCANYGVPFFIKQMQIAGEVCKDIHRFPAGLQIRQYPEINHAIHS